MNIKKYHYVMYLMMIIAIPLEVLGSQATTVKATNKPSNKWWNTTTKIIVGAAALATTVFLGYQAFNKIPRYISQNKRGQKGMADLDYQDNERFLNVRNFATAKPIHQQEILRSLLNEASTLSHVDKALEVVSDYVNGKTIIKNDELFIVEVKQKILDKQLNNLTDEQLRKKLINHIMVNGINTYLDSGETILTSLIVDKQPLFLVQAMLDDGANINQPNNLEMTPLCLASKQGLFEYAELLLNWRGVQIKKCRNYSPFEFAVFGETNDVDLSESRKKLITKLYDRSDKNIQETIEKQADELKELYKEHHKQIQERMDFVTSLR